MRCYLPFAARQARVTSLPESVRAMFEAFLSQVAALDTRLLTWLHQFMFRWPRLDEFLVWLQSARVIKFVPMVLVICWLWVEKTSKQAHNRQILLEGLLTGLGAMVVARVLALGLPFRERPFVESNLHFAMPFDPGLRTWSSFPSDHAVFAFALAASLYRVSPRIGLWACIHATVIICVPRLYLGLHYPSDLFFGGLIGITLVAVASRLKVRHAVTAYLMDIESKYPPMFYAISFLVLFEAAEMFGSFRSLAVALFQVLRQVLS